MTDETQDFDSTDESEGGENALPEDLDRLLERAEDDDDVLDDTESDDADSGRGEIGSVVSEEMMARSMWSTCSMRYLILRPYSSGRQ